MQPKDLQNTPGSRRQSCHYGLIAIFLCCIAAPDAVTALGQGPDKIKGPYSTRSRAPVATSRMYMCEHGRAIHGRLLADDCRREALTSRPPFKRPSSCKVHRTATRASTDMHKRALGPPIRVVISENKRR